MANSRAKFLGHPLHPALTHFPMALLSVSLLWDIIGSITRNTLWWHISFWSLVVGLIFVLPVLTTGLIDSATIAKDGPAEKVMTIHMYVMLCAALLYLGDLLLRLKNVVPSNLGLALALSAVGFLTLVVGGWYGGELVYKHGAGRA